MAQEFVEESQVAQRVADWKSKLQPTLKKQIERKPFDIRQYKGDFIQKLGPQNQTVSFADLMQAENAETFEICRNFLTALHLVSNMLTSMLLISEVSY